MTLAQPIIFRGRRYSLGKGRDRRGDGTYIPRKLLIVWRDGAVEFADGLWFEYAYSAHCQPPDTVLIYEGWECCGPIFKSDPEEVST